MISCTVSGITLLQPVASIPVTLYVVVVFVVAVGLAVFAPVKVAAGVHV